MTSPLGIAERIAAAIGPLRLSRTIGRKARDAGSHARRAAGAGHEFWQYRALAPGEPADKVDWRRSARSDELYVREREREDPVRLWLWVDGSASMDFASGDTPTKHEAALTAALAIAIAASEAGETCCVPPRPAPVKPGRLPYALQAAAPVLPSIGRADTILAAGDFLDEGALDWLHAAADAGASGVVIAVQDRAEIDFPYSGRVRFEAVEPDESPHEIGRADELGVRYREAWEVHRQRLAAIGARPGWLLAEYSTDTSIEVLAARVAHFLGHRG